VTGQPWDLGTATGNGLFPRSSAQRSLLSAFGSSKIAAGRHPDFSGCRPFVIGNRAGTWSRNRGAGAYWKDNEE